MNGGSNALEEEKQFSKKIEIRMFEFQMKGMEITWLEATNGVAFTFWKFPPGTFDLGAGTGDNIDEIPTLFWIIYRHSDCNWWLMGFDWIKCDLSALKLTGWGLNGDTSTTHFRPPLSSISWPSTSTISNAINIHN